MTTVDVLYRYDARPTENAVMSLAKLREVYGIRNVQMDERAGTVRIEYDATRLTEATVRQLVRRAGVTVAEESPLIPPAPEAEPAPVQ